MGLSFYLATMDFKSSNDLEFGMAVINVLPSDGKVIDEGPVGCSVDVCNDDFRFLDVGLPPEILRLKDAGYLSQAIEACDRLLAQNPDPSLAACVRAERYRMLETPLHFSVSRDRAIAMIREEWPEFTEEQFDDLIERKRIDWRFIDGELFVLDNFLDSLRVYPKEVPGKGDVNADGKIDIADVILICRYIMGDAVLSGTEFAAADINNDGKVNAADGVLLCQMISEGNE